jgi:hypothetical protein
MIVRLLVATALTAGLGATPLAAANSVLNGSTSGAQERISGPAAKGAAKRYFAQVSGTCDNAICTASFGKKSGKVRAIETLSCVLIANEPNLLAGVNVSENTQEIEFYLPPASNVDSGGSFFSVFERVQPFTVREGVPFIVLGQTSGVGTAFVCTAVGTIE